MKQIITKQEAHTLLEKYITTPYIIMHSRESAVILEALAKHFKEDSELWYCAGLLHDLDMDTIKGNYTIHGITTKEILEKEGYDLVELIKPILAHTEILTEMHQQFKRETRFDFCLAASEQITGILTAYARMRPNKFEDMKVKSVNKKLKDKLFAANVSREFINDIEKTGIEKNEFLKIAIDAIYEIRNEIEESF